MPGNPSVLPSGVGAPNSTPTDDWYWSASAPPSATKPSWKVISPGPDGSAHAATGTAADSAHMIAPATANRDTSPTRWRAAAGMGLGNPPPVVRRLSRARRLLARKVHVIATSDQSLRADAAVRERLLTAWRGEILAGSVYELIARRLDEREADILRRMAQAESGHRGRIEARMTELGIPVPDAATVKVPLWLRLQARIAPVDRLLAAREAAEDEEVDDLYKRSTGDDDHRPAAARDPQGGALALDGGATRSAARAAAATVGRSRDPRRERRAVTARGAGERARRSGSTRSSDARSGTGPAAGWISGAIYGANDGLAAVFGIVAGVSGATGGNSAVLTAGLAGAIASALSMATGAFLAERSENEVAAANIERERQEIAEHPEEEKEELSLFYQLKGIDPADRRRSSPSSSAATPTRCSRRSPPRSSARPSATAAIRCRRRSRPGSRPGSAGSLP